MSTPQIIEIHHRSDAQCWYEAVKAHNSGLRKGASNKYYIHPNAPGLVDSRALNAQDLMGTALTSYEELNHKRSPLALCLMRIYLTVNRHAKAIDAFVQSNPAIASLVWGSARVLLQISEDHQRTSALASEGVLEILRHVSRWEQISDIAGLLSSLAIRQAVVSLYVKVLDFLVFSTHWMKKSSINRFGSSILSSKAEKIEIKLKTLRSGSDDLDKELQTKATRNNIESVGEISSDIKGLQVTMTHIDTVLQNFQHLSDQVTQSESKLSSIFQEQTTNNMMAKKILTELHFLPVHVTNAYIKQMNENIDFTEIKKWLVLGASRPSPPIRETGVTCQWILNNPSFIKWKNRPEENTLWIQGLPGTGKSVMATFLHAKLCNEGNHNIFYQFQRSASLQSSTPTSFASSVALQILSMSSRLIPTENFKNAVCQLQALALAPIHLSGPQSCPFDTLWNNVLSLLKASRLSFRIVIDALDECHFGGPSQPNWPTFANHLHHLLQVTSSKMLLLSRPEPIFTKGINPLRIIPLDEDQLLPDIMRLADQLVDEFEIPHNRRMNTMEWVRLHSHGSFRWTWLFIDYLGRSIKPSDFDLRMNILPPTVSDLYRKGLEESTGLLDEDELQLQTSLILMVYGTQRELETKEVSDALQLRPDRVEHIISRLCRPFIAAQSGALRFTHPSAREFFGTCPKSGGTPLLKSSVSGADTLLTKICLSTLLRKKYSLNGIAGLLKINYPTEGEGREEIPKADGFYDYASRYWDHHLSRSRLDCNELIEQLGSFLQGRQFVHWAEYSCGELGQHVRTLQAFERVGVWVGKLSKKRTEIHDAINNYLEAPYNEAIVAFQSSDEDPIVQWLARMSLGNYFFTACAESKTTRIRAEVLAGLKALLGPESILTLRATIDYAYTRFYSGNMRAARRLYDKVLATQQRLLGNDHARTLETLVYRGESEYLMADFAQALTTFASALNGFLKLNGPDSWQCLGVQLWYARCLAQLGEFETGLGTLEFVSKKRREQYGVDDPFDSVVRVAIGEILRLMDRNEESIVTLKEVIELQHDENITTHEFKFDIMIALAMSLHAAGKPAEALMVISQLEEKQNLGEGDFDRACQISRIKALVLDNQGRSDEAIQLLQETLIQTEPDQRNRTLLWIRLDVAEMLRRRNMEGDCDEASAVFDHIVSDVSGNEEPGFPEEPDSPRLLSIAERALRLVRARKFHEARKFLEVEEVDWSCSSDFWLRVGGTDFCS